MAAAASHRSGRSSTSSLSGGRKSLPRDAVAASVASPFLKPPTSLSHPAPAASVETLVEHLLAAKRSLSSMAQVLRANDIVTAARQEYEDAAVLAALAEFLRRAILDQASLLVRTRHSLQASYDARRRAFNALIRTMDAANGKLQATMDTLRRTVVRSALRPQGEDPKNLLDFVDETGVQGILEIMKTSLVDLQVILQSTLSTLVLSAFKQTVLKGTLSYFAASKVYLLRKITQQSVQQSFYSDLIRFENDIRALRTSLSDSAPPQSVLSTSPSASGHATTASLFASLTKKSHAMALLLSDLTRHFDLCVTAVQITDDGPELLARRKTTTDEGVSISGVIGGRSVSGAAGQETSPDSLEPTSAKDRDDILRVVVADAAEVDDVVADILATLGLMEEEFSALREQAAGARRAHSGALAAVQALEDVEARIGGYVEAEAEFMGRWEAEHRAIIARLDEMEELHVFYQTYASAYDSLVLEVERRRAVDEKIAAVWRKARDAVDRLADADRRHRDTFRQEIGGFLPTDLWHGMRDGLVRWDIVSVPQPEHDQPDPAVDKAMTPKPIS